jgi:hypothetical protein
MGRPDEEAKREYELEYGVPFDDAETSVLCEDCYLDFLQWMKNNQGKPLQ